MTNTIVLLSETVSRLEAQIRFRFFSKCKTLLFKWSNIVAITDSIQADTGLFLVSSMIIFLLQLTSVYLLCHQHEHGRHFGNTFSGLMPDMGRINH